MRMTNQEAIEAIIANYPSENYTILREALDMAVALLEEREDIDKKRQEFANFISEIILNNSDVNEVTITFTRPKEKVTYTYYPIIKPEKEDEKIWFLECYE